VVLDAPRAVYPMAIKAIQEAAAMLGVKVPPTAET